MTVEIYLCKEGQALRDGKLEISHDINTKQDAQADARERCGYDKTIFKIAYYKVTEDGDFKVFYTFTNPYYTATTRAQSAQKQPQARERVPVRRRPPPKEATLMDKLLKGLGVK